MIPVLVMSRERAENGPTFPTHNPDGTLTRAGALAETHKLYGDLGTISSDEMLPRLVWCIGLFGLTIGRGKTWEQAVQQAKRRHEKHADKIGELLRKERV